MNSTFHTFTFITLGCKVNQYDTQAIRELLVQHGLQEVPPDQPADLCIINTCTVTSAGDSKGRKYIRQMARQNPDAMIVVTGCSVESDSSLETKLHKHIAGENLLLVANDEKMTIPHLLNLDTNGCDSPGKNTWSKGISGFEGHTRAFVKIEDGCDNFCTYCIVPYVRGKIRSRPVESIVAEVERLVDSGYREIVLTGIHLGAWGRESGGELADVVEKLADVRGISRLRLSSIETVEASDRLIEQADTGLICPHFHLPLQSGSDAVLARMNRNYTAGQFIDTVERIRGRIDRPSITTDVIVGFPGETVAEFAETIAICREAGFSRTHIFPYSKRPGTPAAAMRGQVEPVVISERKSILAAIARETALVYKRLFLDETVQVMVETAPGDSGAVSGYTERYVQVEFEGPHLQKGMLVDVELQHATASKAFGRTK